MYRRGRRRRLLAASNGAQRGDCRPTRATNGRSREPRSIRSADDARRRRSVLGRRPTRNARVAARALGAGARLLLAAEAEPARNTATGALEQHDGNCDVGRGKHGRQHGQLGQCVLHGGVRHALGGSVHVSLLGPHLFSHQFLTATPRHRSLARHAQVGVRVRSADCTTDPATTPYPDPADRRRRAHTFRDRSGSRPLSCVKGDALASHSIQHTVVDLKRPNEKLAI